MQVTKLLLLFPCSKRLSDQEMWPSCVACTHRTCSETEPPALTWARDCRAPGKPAPHSRGPHLTVWQPQGGAWGMGCRAQTLTQPWNLEPGLSPQER